ncbi:PAS domain-containing hybrid sensor histidine kinase/response regulator [uncultured Piscinibacter sp.]|uniref:PAS domain-containing hybrid sensor histidine kinase/response regulator n=1 Tax=uncultured Piscinibacter sp. TaxID=1131835 RepID=UPI0026275583|nr:PAS domain-containing hybrid sensor histidine kinase/response regulator [uncultured Piscinibacter sp.]
MDSPLPHDLAPLNLGPLLARLLAIADDAVIVTDVRQNIVLFNQGAERIFGWRVDEVMGRPLARLLPESARVVHEQHLQTFAASPLAARRMGERREIHGRRADGSLFDAEASISHVEIDGRMFFAAILRDVSEARDATRALARSEARFRELAASAPVGIFQTDAQGRCTYVNERWCQMAGMAPAEAAGSGWMRALHPADRARVQQAWSAAVEGHAPFDLRYRFLRPDGTESWVMARAVRSHEVDGTASGFLGTVTDVTESHQQAQALERAKAEAEAAARAKSLFLANMSHEIRTPLNAVIGMTTLLLDTPMSEDQRDFARTIRASGETLLEIINDILDYSKADVGKLEIEQQAFDLRRCVEDSLDLVAPRALEKHLNLAYLIEDGTPEALVGDATRIRQILVNLLSNAVKFTHQGEVFVSVDSEPVDGSMHRIRFSVQDSGIGIPAEHLPRLFQSFTQVDASTTRKYGGTGLGLAISKRLAELMGGTVSVQSEPGHGSLFQVTVLVEAATTATQADFLQRNVPALSGKRLLIVDDNLTNRRILTRLALLWGMVPSTLPSALEALDRIRHGESYEVAVLDMSMPGIDGLELALEIRRRRSAEELPIVMLTSLGQRQALQDAHGAGLAAYLAKPIKASQLFSTLVAVVQGQRSAPQPPAPVPAPQIPVLAASLPLRVLVAEDNTINQRVALRLLQRLGYRADVAANGLEVIDAVERQHYDVVLMDIQMPEMDGLQAARWIVQRRGADGLPRIVAMTANAMPGDRETYMTAGMDGYVAKPIEMGDLAAAMTRVAMIARGGVAPDVDEDEVLDAQRLEHLRGMQDDSQPSLVRELIDMFVADSPSHLGALGDALGAADAARLGRAAHRFLSVTQNIGALRMSQLCAEIERRSRLGEVDGVAPLIESLAQEHERVSAALLAARIRY